MQCVEKDGQKCIEKDAVHRKRCTESRKKIHSVKKRCTVCRKDAQECVETDTQCVAVYLENDAQCVAKMLSV